VKQFTFFGSEDFFCRFFPASKGMRLLPDCSHQGRKLQLMHVQENACTLSQKPYPFPDIWDPLARLFDAWGFDRCLWGTDWTRAAVVVNYEQGVAPFRETSRLSEAERAMLMGGACAKAYGWAPRKS
jgi:Amidohydrolase